MKSAFVGIGSNQGDKLQNCRRALFEMDGLPGCRVSAQSGFYRTEPVGVSGQDWYVNGAAALDTRLPPRELLGQLLAIENRLGRERKERWGPRTLDLDILLYGDVVIDETDLRVPHPMMHLRRFVLVPMVELDPDRVHPVLGQTMAELLQNLSADGQSVIPLERL